MTKEELEIYRKVQHELWIEDAQWRMDEYLEDLDIHIEKIDFEELADRFEFERDASIAESDIWNNIIENYIKEMEK